MVREATHTVVTKAHFDALSHMLAATLPRQDTVLQDCLRKAWEDNKVFLQYKDFSMMINNIGVKPTYEQEKMIKELLVHKKILRIAKMGDIHADVQ